MSQTETDAGKATAARGLRKPQVLKGFRDYLPHEMRLRQDVMGRFRTVFESHGFEPLDTPAIEYLEVLTGKAGENEKLMYEFDDHGGRRVGLRYDLTVPLARVVAMHQAEIALPFKRYHIAPVWRAEKPQRGRFREFWQCDADIAGTSSMLADAEVIAILGECLNAIGLPEFTIQVSHRALLARLAMAAGVPQELAGQVYRSVDKLAKIGPQKVVDELVEGGIEPQAAERVLELTAIEGPPDAVLSSLAGKLGGDATATAAIDELRQIFALLPAMGIPASRVRFDPTLARGLDYYTGPVFEAVVEEPQVGSVAGGGRYEELIGAFANRTVPATGVSLGLERILEVVREFQTVRGGAGAADVLVVTFSATAVDSAAVARELRGAGLRVDMASQSNRGVGDQLKYAARKGMLFAVIPGEEELARNEVALKNLLTGEQRSCSVAGAANAIVAALLELDEA
jgi:histidyl-tRNA synthetase